MHLHFHQTPDSFPFLCVRVSLKSVIFYISSAFFFNHHFLMAELMVTESGLLKSCRYCCPFRQISKLSSLDLLQYSLDFDWFRVLKEESVFADVFHISEQRSLLWFSKIPLQELLLYGLFRLYSLPTCNTDRRYLASPVTTGLSFALRHTQETADIKKNKKTKRRHLII